MVDYWIKVQSTLLTVSGLIVKQGPKNAILLFIGTVLLSACSAERKNVISKTYHNITSHYNAYYYAKERIKEIEGVIQQSHENNYDDILKIYPPVDSVLAKSYAEQTEDCIKKASIAIQRHKNSKWVDDSYILIGLARLYSVDYVNAIETFKYVNKESEDDNARHEGLTYLLRTFTDYQELSNATAVSDYLEKQDLNKKNLKILYINRAHHYQTNEDYDNMVSNLVLATPLLKRKEGKAKVYFIIGQIYQSLGFESEAYNYYRKCVSLNPEYELDFYARLNMTQVTQLGDNSDIKSARRIFNKLLKDRKNKDFKDRIYYEMAEFEFKQNHLENAIENYKASIRESNSNRQKGVSYLKLGQIFYDSLRSYELAQAYYDSTVSVLPQDYDNYDAIVERQQILEEFVQQINTIQLQDSLLQLAEMDSTSLRNYLTEVVQQRKEAEERAEEKAKRRLRNNAILNQNTNSQTTWYFGNPSAVALGQTEFVRIWGERPLEDDWRRANKKSQAPDGETDAEISGQPVDSVASGTAAPSEFSVENEVGLLYAQIPLTTEQKTAALDMMEQAYYRLGSIYKFNLKEPRNAASTFKTLTERFPETEHEPEVLYQLYLIYKDFGEEEQQQLYKDLLIEKYPNTTYAKLLINPNYTQESSEAIEKLKVIYQKAYELYRIDSLDLALSEVDMALSSFPETSFNARLELLKILIRGKREDITQYQFELGQFIETRPDSDVTPYAQHLLEASREFQLNLEKKKGVSYIPFFNQEHYFVLLYGVEDGNPDEISGAVQSFITEFFPDTELKTSNLILNQEQAIILVSQFTNNQDAMSFFERFYQESAVTETIPNLIFSKFVISKDNFSIFYQAKEVDAYLRFFEKYY